MALRFLEGFEEYTTTSGVALANEMAAMRSHNGYRWQYGYDGSYMQVVSSPTRSSQSITTSKSLALRNSHIDIQVPTVTEVFVGIAVYFTADGSFLSFSNSYPSSSSLPTNGIRLRRNTAGFIEVIRNNDSVIIAVTESRCLLPSCWNYVELRYKFGVTGDIQIRVENVEVLNLTGIDTRGTAANIQNISLFNTNAGIISYYDDLYICDATGIANNTFLGPIGVQTLVPTADVQTNFTRNAGTSNYSCVNEIPHTSATSYVSSDTLGHRDLYEVSDLSGTGIGPIAGVQCNVRGQALGAAATFALTVDSAGGTTVGTTKTQTTSGWNVDFDIFEKQADGSAWSATEVNNAKIGFDNV